MCSFMLNIVNIADLNQTISAAYDNLCHNYSSEFV